MADAIKINGGCYCGDITITGEVSSDKIMACHCTDCQKVQRRTISRGCGYRGG
jgi:hypothetical protein